MGNKQEGEGTEGNWEKTWRELGGNLAGTWRKLTGRRRELGGNSRGGGGNLAETRRKLGGNLVGTWQELVFARALSTIFPEFPEISRFHGFRSTKLNMFLCSGRPTKVSGRLHEIAHFLQRPLQFGTMFVFAVAQKAALTALKVRFQNCLKAPLRPLETLRL